ncbi:MAG: YigZ family protein [Clostridiales bacterium]|jgi:uncharacterized YigZ family protein|nr:YigZ family protein [Clostridiales bacterium]
MYYSIDKKTVAETVIKRSRFIASLIPVNSAEEAEYSINAAKREYYDAAHNCYAYIITANEARFSDDGEPQGTAGPPMLSVLKKRRLERVLAIVTRYFGGVKLGAGGLVSAYTRSLAACIDSADIKQYAPTKTLRLSFGYNAVKTVDSTLKSLAASVQNAEYADGISYAVSVPEENYSILKTALIENTSSAIVFYDDI